MSFKHTLELFPYEEGFGSMNRPYVELGILWILKELLADKAGMDPQFFHTVIKVATAKLKCTEAELLQEIRDAAL